MAVLKTNPVLKVLSGTFLAKLFFALVVFCLTTGMAQSPQMNPSKEQQIKAAFIFNFTQFVEWPDNALSNNAPLIIGVLGKNTFGNYLNTIVQGEKVNGHQIVVKYYPTLDDFENCHILFINLSKQSEIKQALEKAKSHNILTISDSDTFTRQEGIIQFFTRNNKMQLKINIENAANANLIISSKLLRLAEIVK